MLYRSLFLCLLFIATFAAPANAMVGDDIYRDQPDLFCPARVVSVIPMHEQPATEPDLGTDDVFAVKLVADAPKTVSGTFQVLSGNQPFRVTFSNVTLTPSPNSYSNNIGTIKSGTAYYSPSLYFELPRRMPIHAVWIYDIASDGKTADCGTMPLVHLLYKIPETIVAHDGGATVEDVRMHRPEHPPLAVAEKQLDLRDCATPIKQAEMIAFHAPEYPNGVALRATQVIVVLALDAAGHVADASVLQRGASQAFDAAALSAAMQSRFNPRLFLCSSIPGRYELRVNFDPQS